MNNKFFLVCLLFIFSMLLGIGAGVCFVNLKPQNMAKAEVAAPPLPTPKTEKVQEEFIKPQPKEEKEVEVYTKEQYVVTLSDTKILIYKIAHDGSMQTVEERQIDIGSIPSSDYGKLYSGIVVDSLEEAKILMEDYLS